jgi:hypothetical protein
VVLQIDNGYSDVTKAAVSERPRELLAPLTGTGAAAGSRADAARHALAIQAARSKCDLRLSSDESGNTRTAWRTYFHVYPRARPGIQAPLGWSLSEVARADMRSQVASARNGRALCGAKQWLVVERLNCVEPPAEPVPFGAETLPGSAYPVAMLVVPLTVLLTGLFRRNFDRERKAVADGAPDVKGPQD